MKNQVTNNRNVAKKTARKARKKGLGLREQLEFFLRRFSWDRTDRAARKQLFGFGPLNKHVGFTLTGAQSHEDVVRTICEQAVEPIPIKFLSPQLRVPGFFTWENGFWLCLAGDRQNCRAIQTDALVDFGGCSHHGHDWDRRAS